MKFTKLLGYLFILLGLCAAVLTVWVGFHNIHAEPVLLKSSDAATRQVVDMMEAFCEGNYAEAEQRLLGDIQMGADGEAADPVGQLVWETFLGSLRYELVGEQYATNEGLAQRIRIVALDMDVITAYIEANTKSRLDAEVTRRLETRENLDEIYDDNNEYRDSFVSKILMETAQEAVKLEPVMVETELTLSLAWENGKWWVVPNDLLFQAVSGGTVG